MEKSTAARGQLRRRLPSTRATSPTLWAQLCGRMSLLISLLRTLAKTSLRGERGTGLPNLGSLAQQLYNNRNLPGALALLPPELRNILNQQGSQEEIIRQVTEWLNGDANGDGVKDYLTVPLSVAFTANTTPMELARADRNTTKLSWTALNASKCTAINDWLSADKIIKARNANIQTSGTLTIEHPYTFPVTITRNPDIFNWANGRITSVADEKLISQRTAIDLASMPPAWVWGGTYAGGMLARSIAV